MRLPFLLLFFTLSFQLTAQKSIHHSKGQPPVLKGQLIGYDLVADKDLELKGAMVVPSANFQIDTFLPIAEDGSFELQLLYPLRYQQVWFSIGDYYFGELILDQGLTITADLNTLKKKDPKSFYNEDIKFSGPDGPLTTQVNRFVSYRNEQEDWPGGSIMSVLRDREASPEDKVKRMKGIYEQIAAIQERFFELYPSDFEVFMRNEKKSDLYGWLATFYWRAEMPQELLAEMLAHQPMAVTNDSHSYYGYLAKYFQIPSEEDYLNTFKTAILPKIESPAETNRMKHFIQLFTSKLAEESYDETIYKEDGKYFYRQYKKELEIAKLEDYKTNLAQANLDPEKAAMIILQGGSKDIFEQDLYVKTMQSVIQPEWASEIMKNEWAKDRVAIQAVNERLAKIKIPEKASKLGTPKGELEDGTTFYLAEQDNLETLLAAIRADHPGKAILLDVWATWCAPCIYDMKEGKENKEKLKEMGVEVVYICSSEGSNPDTWKKKVTELKVNTQHFFLSDALSKEIMQYFNLNGFPSHIFLDVNGQMVPNVINGLRTVDFDKVKESISQ